MSDGHWFDELADHMGPAYLRYSFTKGTRQEVDSLVDVLGLAPGDRILDVGCGPGRHVYEFARRGIAAHGVDISATFVDLAAADAPPGATFERGDARTLVFDAEFDAVVSLCQGAFGLGGPGPFDHDPQNLDHELSVLDGIRRALRPGGRAAISAFNAYFQLQHLAEENRFDAATGVNTEATEVRDPSGRARSATLWTTCFTARELRLLVEAAGLEVVAIYGVEPGAYGTNPPSIDLPEFLTVVRRPTTG